MNRQLQKNYYHENRWAFQISLRTDEVFKNLIIYTVLYGSDVTINEEQTEVRVSHVNYCNFWRAGV